MRAAALAGLRLAPPPGQLYISRWIEQWGADSVLSSPMSIRDAARMSAITDIYDRFVALDMGLRKAIEKGRSAGVVLFDMQQAGQLSEDDYKLILELMQSDQYKPKG